MAEVIHDAAENHVNGFDQLDNLKHQMELRGSELGKTWAELSRIMSQYQSQLIQKHDNYKTNLSTDDQHRVAKLETIIEKKALQIQQLEKANDDLSTRLLEKDSEIVRLRTEVHQSKNEVSMKDALIDKLQSQMAKEALEYQTEVTSLKEMLVQGVTAEVTSREHTEEGGEGTGATNLTTTTPGLGSKRRRLAPTKAVTSTPVSVTSASTSSQPSGELLLQTSIRTVTFPSSTTSDALNPQILPSRPHAFPDSLTSVDEPLEMEAYGGFTEDEENFYKGEEVSEDSLARYELEEADSSQLDMSGQETVNRDVSSVTDMRTASVTSPLGMTASLPMMTSARLAAAKATATMPARDHLASFSIMEKMRSALCRCTVCGKGFPSKWALDRHMKTHSGIKPYQCVVCDAKFTEKYNATVHVMNVHRKGPDQAKDCVITVHERK